MSAPGRSRKKRLELQGAVWMAAGDERLGGYERFGLLRAIAQQGSLTHAAKAVGISYKGAWNIVEHMNRLAREPLVQRSLGGRGGGSTCLTPRGERLLQRFEQIDAAHQRFIRMLDAADLDNDGFSLLRILNMKTSARNQFIGTVTAVRAGAVNDEVELSLTGGPRIVAVVTRASTESLGLRTNISAIALIKSSSVLLATDLEGAKLSARNQLPGTVSAVVPGAVNAEVTLDLDGGGSITSIVTEGSVKALGLAPGVRAIAFFKASSVILGTTA